jgi:hypothetical protein
MVSPGGLGAGISLGLFAVGAGIWVSAKGFTVGKNDQEKKMFVMYLAVFMILVALVGIIAGSALSSSQQLSKGEYPAGWQLEVPDGVASVSASADGRWVAAGSPTALVGQGEVRVLDATTKEEKFLLSGGLFLEQVQGDSLAERLGATVQFRYDGALLAWAPGSSDQPTRYPLRVVTGSTFKTVSFVQPSPQTDAEFSEAPQQFGFGGLAGVDGPITVSATMPSNQKTLGIAVLEREEGDLPSYIPRTFLTTAAEAGGTTDEFGQGVAHTSGVTIFTDSSRTVVLTSSDDFSFIASLTVPSGFSYLPTSLRATADGSVAAIGLTPAGVRTFTGNQLGTLANAVVPSGAGPEFGSLIRFHPKITVACVADGQQVWLYHTWLMTDEPLLLHSGLADTTVTDITLAKDFIFVSFNNNTTGVGVVQQYARNANLK